MRKIKIIGVFIIFALSFLFHFLYKWLPNPVFSILFPVNESIWEHMKLLVSPVLLFGIFEYIWYRKKNIKYNNFLLSYTISSVLGILIYLVLYLPIDALIGHNTIVAIIILFITFIIIEIISYYIMNFREIKGGKSIAIFLVVIIYLFFFYFTYYPPINDLFYDPSNKVYGIEDK